MKERIKKPHFHVTAGVIWRNGKVLIAKRPKGSHLQGLWEFPGGKQEKGETLRHCLEREIKEELALKINAGHTLLTVDHEYESKVISLHVFECICPEGEPMPLQCQDIKWVDPVTLTKLAFPPPDIKVIEFLTKKLRISLR